MTGRPPRGWNSFDAYGLNLHEQAALDNLEIMATRLKPAGYDMFVIDGGWYNEYELIPGTLLPAHRQAVDVHIDEFGRYLPSRTYFPSGLAGIASRAHELGLRAGIHIMRGIPRRAVELDLPVAGTGSTARDIADISSTCRWSTANYGVDMRKPSGQAYYDGWIAMLAEWGFDFIKADDVTAHPAEIEAIATAIARAGRPMMLSLSPGGDTDEAHLAAYRRANMLRVTPDIWDNRDDLNVAFEAWERWNRHPDEPMWIDLDMLPLGSLLVPFGRDTGRHSAALHGRGAARTSRLTPAQQRTLLSTRALAASPLFLGADLPTTDEVVFDMVTNAGLLACHDNAVRGHLVHRERDLDVWRSAVRDGATVWLGVFNRGAVATTVAVTDWMTGTTDWIATDVWTARVITANSPVVTLAADDVALYRCEGAPSI